MMQKNQNLYHSSEIPIPNRQFTVRFTGILLALVVAVSCSDNATDPDPGPDPTEPGLEQVDGDLGEDTEYVDEHVVEAALTNSDEENHTYTFNADALADADITLEEGEILLLAGKALRKISTVNESGGEITVETEYASLNEAFRELNVDHTQELDFTQTTGEKVVIEYDGRLLRPNKVTKSGKPSWKYEFGDVTVEGSLEVETDKADIELLVKYDTGDVSGAMLTSTSISGFENQTVFDIDDHETKSFQFNNRGLEGTMNMRFILAGGNSSEEKWEPPMPAIILPYTIGPIPVTLRIGTAYVYKLDLEADGSAEFETSFSYSGDLGFNVEGTNFTPMMEGGINNPAADDAVGNAAGFGGTVSGQFGVGIPQVTFNVFGDAVVPYLQSEFYIGASYTFPTCTKLFSRYEINAGVNMKMFGLADLNFDHNFVNNPIHDYNSEGCGSSKETEMPVIRLENLSNQQPDVIETPFQIR